jgi:cytochrome P450
VSTAPRIDIEPAAFWQDPYPTLARLRREAPIAFVPQLGSTLLCSRDDIFVSEKQIDVFSSHQPEGLMTKLMGHNMMRKDGDAHMVERKAIFPAISPKTVKSHWTAQFQAHADRIIDALERSGAADLVKDFALPFSAECLKSITGLTNMRFQDMNAMVARDDRWHRQLCRRSGDRGTLSCRDGRHRCGDRRYGPSAEQKARS